MTWEDDLPNDHQPGGVLGKMPWEDDLSNDQPGGVVGKMPWEDDSNMEGEYMNTYDAYTRYVLNGSPRLDFLAKFVPLPMPFKFF